MGIQNFHRAARWLNHRGIPLLPKLIYYLQLLLFNSHIPYQVKIGKGTKFSKGGIATVIHPRCKIGSNCTIGSCVTLGGRSGIYDVPVLGNNVWVSVGAVIIGDVKVGDNAIIGANAVVIDDVEPNEVVGGVPAKHLKFRKVE